jgi:hypothetical protein
MNEKTFRNIFIKLKTWLKIIYINKNMYSTKINISINVLCNFFEEIKIISA